MLAGLLRRIGYPLAGAAALVAARHGALPATAALVLQNNLLVSQPARPVRFRVNNIRAGELNPVTGTVFWGLRAGNSNTNGFSNVAIGTDAFKLNANGSNKPLLP